MGICFYLFAFFCVLLCVLGVWRVIFRVSLKHTGSPWLWVCICVCVCVTTELSEHVEHGRVRVNPLTVSVGWITGCSNSLQGSSHAGGRMRSDVHKVKPHLHIQCAHRGFKQDMAENVDHGMKLLVEIREFFSQEELTVVSCSVPPVDIHSQCGSWWNWKIPDGIPTSALPPTENSSRISPKAWLVPTLGVCFNTTPCNNSVTKRLPSLVSLLFCCQSNHYCYLSYLWISW